MLKHLYEKKRIAKTNYEIRITAFKSAKAEYDSCLIAANEAISLLKDVEMKIEAEAGL